MENEIEKNYTEVMVHYSRKVNPERYGSEEFGCALKEKVSQEMSPKERKAHMDALAKECRELTHEQLAIEKKEREKAVAI